MRNEECKTSAYAIKKESVMENKREFIKALEAALRTDERSDVESIDYLMKDDMEIICIKYDGGHKDYINARMNSNGANAKEIIAQVYGSGAYGLIQNKDIDKEYQEAVTQLEHDAMYEPTFSSEDGSM